MVAVLDLSSVSHESVVWTYAQDPADYSGIFNKFGELRGNILPRYNKALKARDTNARRLSVIVPILFLFLWGLDVLIYFVIIDGDPD